MPVSDDEREAIKKMDQPAKGAAVLEHLKCIREASTGPAMNHYAVNDALDHIEVLIEEAPAKEPHKTRAEMAKEKAEA